eukprot:scaffold255921_cov40-Prasinocladus_malaysianus.AAC.1
MLGTLLTIYARIHVHNFNTLDTKLVRHHRTWLEYFCVYVPWSLYSSWVLGATLISIFVACGKAPEESINGGIAALSFAAFANLMVLAWARDPWFAGVNVWTLIAIAYNQSDLPLISGSAIALAGVVGASALVTWVVNVLDLVPAMSRFYSRGSKGSLHEAMLGN